ncbi:MAG: (d)CMP kinase [Actinomycetota bacterium]
MTVIAIDGPAGAGKSTVGRAVASALGWRFVDTGAMYRSVALVALDRGVELGDGPALERLAATLRIDATTGSTTVDDADVTRRIRDADVTRAASRVAAHPGVRRVLTAAQREVAARRDVVMEGRDIAAVVAPDADVKIFLTASLPQRARRRARQLQLDADPVLLQELERSLAARDEADAARAASPFARAPDAVLVDSTDMDLNAVVAAVLEATRAVRDDR